MTLGEDAFFADIDDKWHEPLVGPDLGAAGRKNRARRTTAGGRQFGTDLSRNGLHLLIPEEATLEEHISTARRPPHPFTAPPDLPLDLQYAARQRAERPWETDQARHSAMAQLESLAAVCEPLDEKFRVRMPSSVRVAAG